MILGLKDFFISSLEKLSIKILIKTLLISFPVFLIILVATLIILSTREKLEMRVYRSAEESTINNRLMNVQNEMNHAISDLLVLASNSHIKQYLKYPHHKDMHAHEDVANDMLNLLTHNDSYDQARLINENGMEVIRINYNEGHPLIVSENELQNKKHRYYFYETFKLNDGELFISPLDLNIENSKIELPHKPMIRIGTPVFDDQGVKRGIILFNYFGQKILNQLETDTNSLIQNQLMLLNADGYWLKSPDPMQEWGFMYDDKKEVAFSVIYPDAWNRINESAHSQFETDLGLFTSTTIYPTVNVQRSNNGLNEAATSDDKQEISMKYYWKIVSFVPSKLIHSNRNERRKFVAIIFILFSASLLFITWKFVKAQHARKKALRALKISNNTKDKFFSVVSHDLKAPFNSLLGFSDLLLSEIEEGNISNVKKYSSKINETLNQTFDFLVNLLDWSRSQTESIKYEPAFLILSDLINEVFDLLNLQAEAKGIELYNSVPEDLKIFADRNILNTVIRNMVSNAIKYSNNGGKVAVTANLSNNFLHCSISDTGVGIDDKTLTKLFQLDTLDSMPGTNNEKGTGLGLILSKELIENCGGRIGAQSEIGKGSTFWFEIPQSN